MEGWGLAYKRLVRSHKRGGMMFTQPAADVLPVSGKGSMGGFTSRVRGLPAFAGEYPVACVSGGVFSRGNLNPGRRTN